MKQRISPYAARTESERQRNNARLGTRWQQNSTPEPPRYEEAARRAWWWWEGFTWGWFWGSWKWMVVLGGSLLGSGCYDVALWQARTFYGLECREDKLVNGRCVPVQKEKPNAQTAQP